MKTNSLSLFVMILLISCCCVAQGRPAAGTTGATGKALIVLGRVSADARTLSTDLDSEWRVANASMLKGYEDRLVRVRCFVDAEKNQLHILSVKTDSGGSTFATRYGDSAFRR